MTLTTAELRRIVTTTPRASLPDLAGLLAEHLMSIADTTPPLTITQVSDLLGVTPDTLRWYERIGLVTVPRTSGGNRSYDVEAIARVAFVARMRMADMPVAEIASYVKLGGGDAASTEARRTMLENHRERLRSRIDELELSLAVIDYKIVAYGGECDPDAPLGA